MTLTTAASPQPATSQGTADALLRDVEALAKPGGRAVGAPGHERARRQLVHRLEEIGVPPYTGDRHELPYGPKGGPFANIVGRIEGSCAGDQEIVVGAHYDTCGPTPGADDNAAAVAIVLELAERLVRAPAPCSVVLALFDAEEPPYFQSDAMGSRRFYTEQRTAETRCAFILDLVGHAVELPGLEDGLFLTGVESAPELEELVRSTPAPGLRIAAVPNAWVGDLSDHEVFRIHGRPYLFLTCGRWRHYHQPTDTPDRLDYPKMARITDHLERLVRGTEPEPPARSAGPYDPIDTLLAMANAAIPAQLRTLAGVQRLRTRPDLRQLVEALKSHGV